MAAEGNDIANFFNEVQLASSGAQISATSLANEVAGLPQIVHRRDVLTAYPYTNTLTVLEISGEVLRKAIERSAEYFALDDDGQLCVSDQFLKPKVEHYNFDYYAGVDYTIDVKRPIGQRVSSPNVSWAASDRTGQLYDLCQQLSASGAGGYPMYLHCPVVREINAEMSDLILDFSRASHF
ncbi:MAG: 5'-nucleotidase C-terminal domain-containing protein [Oscillospiraceae bacterium]